MKFEYMKFRNRDIELGQMVRFNAEFLTPGCYFNKKDIYEVLFCGGNSVELRNVRTNEVGMLRYNDFIDNYVVVEDSINTSADNIITLRSGFKYIKEGARVKIVSRNGRNRNVKGTIKDTDYGYHIVCDDFDYNDISISLEEPNLKYVIYPRTELGVIPTTGIFYVEDYESYVYLKCLYTDRYDINVGISSFCIFEDLFRPLVFTIIDSNIVDVHPKDYILSVPEPFTNFTKYKFIAEDTNMFNTYNTEEIKEEVKMTNATNKEKPETGWVAIPRFNKKNFNVKVSEFISNKRHPEDVRVFVQVFMNNKVFGMTTVPKSEYREESAIKDAILNGMFKDTKFKYVYSDYRAKADKIKTKETIRKCTCNICGSKFNTAQEATTCENNHKLNKKIKSIKAKAYKDFMENKIYEDEMNRLAQMYSSNNTSTLTQASTSQDTHYTTNETPVAVSKGTKRYSEGYKREVVKFYKEHGSLTDTGARFGVAPSTISRWVEKYGK